MLCKLFFELFEHIIGILKHRKLTPAVVEQLEHALFVGIIFSAKTLEKCSPCFYSVIFVGRKLKPVAEVSYTLGCVVYKRRCAAYNIGSFTQLVRYESGSAHKRCGLVYQRRSIFIAGIECAVCPVKSLCELFGVAQQVASGNELILLTHAQLSIFKLFNPVF